MLKDRGVHQVGVAGGLIQLNVTTSEGITPITLFLDPDRTSPEMRRQIVARATRWLDAMDPPLRLVSGAAQLPRR